MVRARKMMGEVRIPYWKPVMLLTHPEFAP